MKISCLVVFSLVGIGIFSSFLLIFGVRGIKNVSFFIRRILFYGLGFLFDKFLMDKVGVRYVV